MTTRAEAVAEAITWFGTPYHHHARIKSVGVDCAQFLVGVYAAVGMVPDLDLGNYAHDWHLNRSVEVYANQVGDYMSKLDDTATPQGGDVALFRFGRTFSHGGIFIDSDTIIHSYIGLGVIYTKWREEAPLAGRDFMLFTFDGFTG